MGERRTRNSNFWANYVSAFPIWGSSVARGIQQKALSKNQAEEAAKINPVDPTYQESPYAKENLDNARNLYNGRMAGATNAEANINANQANSFFNLSRAAGNPQQLMAAAGALQSNSNNALNNLAAQEAQYKNSMFGNLNNALEGMTLEQGKVYNDNLRKFDRDFALKQNLLNSSQQNNANSTQSFGNAATSIANTALNLATAGFVKPNKITAPTQAASFRTTNGFSNPGTNWFNPVANYNPSITPYRP